MSETLAARIKATGFSHFTMKCRLSEAASKIHPERKIVENKPISYQQQLICVMLSHAELLPVLQQSLLLREVKLNSLAHWKKTKGVLSPGININLSFRFWVWKGHLVISHMVSCGISLPLNSSIDHWNGDMTLTLTLWWKSNLLPCVFCKGHPVSVATVLYSVCVCVRVSQAKLLAVYMKQKNVSMLKWLIGKYSVQANVMRQATYFLCMNNFRFMLWIQALYVASFITKNTLTSILFFECMMIFYENLFLCTCALCSTLRDFSAPLLWLLPQAWHQRTIKEPSSKWTWQQSQGVAIRADMQINISHHQPMVGGARGQGEVMCGQYCHWLKSQEKSRTFTHGFVVTSYNYTQGIVDVIKSQVSSGSISFCVSTWSAFCSSAPLVSFIKTSRRLLIMLKWHLCFVYPPIQAILFAVLL